jgi:hypothetical protein
MWNISFLDKTVEPIIYLLYSINGMKSQNVFKIINSAFYYPIN